ncbi:MAG: NYN domain-containing protein [Defluviitaleaceae bacterium]|nr:NYN domain-containing protein [Defluviitaleaceae bacterium]
MKREYLFVDAYNIIFSWENLKQLAGSSLEDARKKLLDILSDYQGSLGAEVIVVFDAHNVAANPGSINPYDNLTVVYTKEDETADNYIERCARILAKNYKVRVATNDNLQQIMITGKGAIRISANELYEEVVSFKKEQNAKYVGRRPVKRNQLFDNLDDNLKETFMRMIRQEGDK